MLCGWAGRNDLHATDFVSRSRTPAGSHWSSSPTGRPASTAASAVNPRPVVLGCGGGCFVLPVLVGLGFALERDGPRSPTCEPTTERARVENRSYRAATGELTAQIQALQAAVGAARRQGRRSIRATAKAMERLPAIVKVAGGGRPAASAQASRSLYVPALRSPEDTFGVLRDLLYSLESRLQVVQVGVERRQALARRDAVDLAGARLAHGFVRQPRAIRSPARREFHTGLDISADKGEPVFATANGTVAVCGDRAAPTATWSSIDHGFGLVDALRPPRQLQREGRRQRQARRRDRLRRLDGPRHRRPPALRSARQRPDAQPAPVPRRPLAPAALDVVLQPAARAQRPSVSTSPLGPFDP